MYISFYIDTNRLTELKTFIRNFTPSARFKHNPLKQGSKFFIALDLEVEDGNKMNNLFLKWDKEDNPPEIKKKSSFSKLLSVFKIKKSL